jgi:hypothetical protein
VAERVEAAESGHLEVEEHDLERARRETLQRVLAKLDIPRDYAAVLGVWPRPDGRVVGHPEDEPSAGKPHARLCEGESRMAELLD